MYEADVLKQRFWSGTLNQQGLQEIPNRRSDAGWELGRTVTSSVRILLLFERESLLLIF